MAPRAGEEPCVSLLKMPRWRMTTCGPATCPRVCWASPAPSLHQPSCLQRRSFPGTGATTGMSRGSRLTLLCTEGWPLEEPWSRALCVSTLNTWTVHSVPRHCPQLASQVASQPQGSRWGCPGARSPAPSVLPPCPPSSLTDGLCVDVDLVLAGDSLPPWRLSRPLCPRGNGGTPVLPHSAA